MSKHWTTSHTTRKGESFVRMPIGFVSFLHPCLSSTSARYHSTLRVFRSFLRFYSAGVLNPFFFFSQFLSFLGRVRFVRCVSSSTCRFDAYVSFLSWGRAWIFGLVCRLVVSFLPLCASRLPIPSFASHPLPSAVGSVWDPSVACVDVRLCVVRASKMNVAS